MSKPWAESQAERIATEIRRLRLRGKRSGQWLSDRTGELGYRISRTTISEMENGGRKYFTTAELTVLARALEIPPVTLLVPPPYDKEIEMLPGVVATKLFAVEAFCGNGTAAGVTYGDNAWLLRRAREHASLEQQQQALLTLLGSLPEVDEADRERLERPIYAELQRLAERLSELKADPDGG
jgi:hypothetical protein